MQYFQIESRNTTREPFRVRAHDSTHAAQIAARRLHGRIRGLCAVQVTGDRGTSGWWQAYVPCRVGTGLTSHGRNFHVRPA
jgi:hypothetical protein